MLDIDAITANLNKVLMDTDEALSNYLNSDAPIEEVAGSLVELHALKNAMGDVYSTYANRVMALLQNANIEDLDVAGAKIEVRHAADRKKWNHEQLSSAVTKRLVDMSVDMDTGEMLLSPQDIADKMLGFIQPAYWRVKELAKFGINADNFCEVGEYKTNIIIRKAK
jgi:hypothetical protein